jgi:hypothetical protein
MLLPSRVFLVFAAAHTSLGLNVNARFDELATRYGVHSRVRLATPPGKERGLFTTSAIKAGEPVLAVPFELCLVCRAEPGDIKSPWDAPHQEARDTLLARQLLQALFAEEAAEGEDPSAPDELREFWQEWSVMLPELHTLAHPITLSEESCRGLHDSQLSHAAKLQQRRVDAVLAGLPKVIGDSGVDARNALEAEAAALRRWAVALCSSRPFSLPYESAREDDEESSVNVKSSVSSGLGATPPRSSAAQQQLAAFVPFIDMANHDAEPNCYVQVMAPAEPLMSHD